MARNKFPDIGAMNDRVKVYSIGETGRTAQGAIISGETLLREIWANVTSRTKERQGVENGVYYVEQYEITARPGLIAATNQIELEDGTRLSITGLSRADKAREVFTAEHKK